jgi:ectoine hydroxylase-related dioxygenase (phytanoyl-CoA dioxygenase family)
MGPSRVIALRIHLNSSTSDNGPLRVIAGSEHGGVLSDEEVFHLARTSKHVDCLVAKGGVLAMRPLLVHSSSKGRANGQRRVLHVEYADSLNLNEHLKLVVA